jgi:hypothetical protein
MNTSLSIGAPLHPVQNAITELHGMIPVWSVPLILVLVFLHLEFDIFLSIYWKDIFEGNT